MDEYISRKELLEDIQAAEDHGGMGSLVAGTLKRYVKRVPAADVAPKSEIASEIFDRISQLSSVHLGWNEPRIIVQIGFDELKKLKDEYTKGGK